MQNMSFFQKSDITISQIFTKLKEKWFGHCSKASNMHQNWWRICLQCRRPRFHSWVGKIPWRRDRLPTPVFLVFPGGSDSKEFAHNAGGLDWADPLEKGSGLENSTDCTIHGVTKSRTQLSNFHFHIHIYTHIHINNRGRDMKESNF